MKTATSKGCISPSDLLEYIKRHGLSQAEAAERMYLRDTRSVRRYLSGKRRIDPARWATLRAWTEKEDKGDE